MNTPNSSFLPLPPDETIEPFRVEGTMAVRALVRELIGAGALVTLYAGDDPDSFIVSRIEADGIAPIPCDLRVVRVETTDDGQPPVLSCEFEAMPQTVSRFVQLYVMDIEKRARNAMQKP